MATICDPDVVLDAPRSREGLERFARGVDRARAMLRVAQDLDGSGERDATAAAFLVDSAGVAHPTSRSAEKPRRGRRDPPCAPSIPSRRQRSEASFLKADLPRMMHHTTGTGVLSLLAAFPA